ncbi:hypothetical protein C6P45_002293 [Maudiozyma exigua]|uniref:HMG box domain-containing protein n=1 Tax=Maudiozyma exigua TaxID=34358 RepID=A0A9P7B4E6_MAUEX|nr:hypothetical protein C6P45_002293 [Kazachstania exigua]
MIPLHKFTIKPVSLLFRQFSIDSTLFASRSLPSTSKLRDVKRNELLRKKPKRPLNSYMLFCKEQRVKIAEEYPNLKITEVASMMGSTWKQLSETEKLPYQEEAQRLSEAHSTKMAEFERKLPPKKPAGPFVLFAKDIRAQINEEYPDSDFVEKI